MSNATIPIRIPTPLRPYAGRQSSVDLQGETVEEAIRDLTGRYPDLHEHLFDDEGNLRSFVNLYLNGEDVRHLRGVATRLSPGDRLSIIPAIAGG